MGYIYASELVEPAEWIGATAHDVMESVKRAGGWGKLWPKGVPIWLHKIRNYFNVEPQSLRLVDADVTRHWMQDIKKHGKLTGVVGSRTLTGDVYFDEEVEVWYQMSAGGTIYHWGRDVIWDKADAAHTQLVRTQKGVPIFKLICPDGTGGSKETIVSNPVVRKVRVMTGGGRVRVPIQKEERGEQIGATNDSVLVLDRIETRMKYQGSYNFAETAVRGLDEHEKHDVHPHKKDAVYIDPPDRFEPLTRRIFNEFILKTAGAI